VLAIASDRPVLTGVKTPAPLNLPPRLPDGTIVTDRRVAVVVEHDQTRASSRLFQASSLFLTGQECHKMQAIEDKLWTV